MGPHRCTAHEHPRWPRTACVPRALATSKANLAFPYAPAHVPNVPPLAHPTAIAMWGPNVIPPHATTRPPGAAQCAPRRRGTRHSPHSLFKNSAHSLFSASAHPLVSLNPPPSSLVLVVLERRSDCPSQARHRRPVPSPPPPRRSSHGNRGLSSEAPQSQRHSPSSRLVLHRSLHRNVSGHLPFPSFPSSLAYPPFSIPLLSRRCRWDETVRSRRCLPLAEPQHRLWVHHRA